MQDRLTARPRRQVRVHTLSGVVDGHVAIAPQQRTLDDLNAVNQGFVVLHDPESRTPSWVIGRQPLAINRNSILLVAELSEFRPSGDNRCGNYTRASMGVALGPYSVRGFVHVPPLGDPFKRLHQAGRPFLALTSVSVVAPDVQFASAFVAINRNHVNSAQALSNGELTDEAAPQRDGAPA